MSDKRARPGVRTKIYVRDDMIGGGKVDLLRVVAETGSVSGAARKMGMSIRRARFLIDTLQACFAEPLTQASPSGTEVTALGLDLLRRHAEHEAAIQALSAPFLEWLEARQPVADAKTDAA